MNKKLIHKGFVYLDEVDPTIAYDIKYATDHNFIGRPLPGYKRNRAVVSMAVAKKLALVQKELKKTWGDQLSIKVYEGYRPLKAGEYMLKWASDPSDQETKEEFYKHIDKKYIHSLGYLAKRSKHSRGAAVDLTIINNADKKRITEKYSNGMSLYDGALTPHERRIYDDNMDFGTSFDCFHERSHTFNEEISAIAKRNRKMLMDIMTKYGFRNYEKEWWHFELIEEPFPDQYFDFDIM